MNIQKNGDDSYELVSEKNASSWERKMLEQVLSQLKKEQNSNMVWKWIKRVLWILLILTIILSIIASSKSNLTKNSGPHTAVIDLYGTIDSYNDNANKLIQGLENAYANKNVVGIIIRADSPGGSPVISDTAFQEIRFLKERNKDIPLYVVAEDVCASGCYYIASAADKIYANPSSVVGSIGVIGGSFGFTKLMENMGIERRLKTAGANKGIGDPFSPETEEQSAIWQQMLDEIHAEFIKSVKMGRGKVLKWQGNADVFSGRIYTGVEAKKVGLIDDFGSMYTVSRDVLNAPDIVNYTPKESLSDTLGRNFGAQAKQAVKVMMEPSW